MEDALTLRRRADKARHHGSAMTTAENRARLLTYADALYRQADAIDAAVRLEAGDLTGGTT